MNVRAKAYLGGSLGVILQEPRECVELTPQNACNPCWLHLSHDGLCCGNLHAYLSRWCVPLEQGQSLLILVSPKGPTQSFVHNR